MTLKHVVLYSGGHSSGLVAIEVVRKFGKENVILLNHDISDLVEDQDIKRFKNELSEYLEVPITYANHPDKNANQFTVCIDSKAFKGLNNHVLCTTRLKTEPFTKWLSENFSDKNCILYYGFDKNEMHRVQRRSSILSEMGYKSDYPLALWNDLTIKSTEDIGISRPLSYSSFKHANCIGCLKAGMQHWYVVYCNRPDIFKLAKNAEEVIGYAIHKNGNGEPEYLAEIEEKFNIMKYLNIPATENISSKLFWTQTSKILLNMEDDRLFPCECSY